MRGGVVIEVQGIGKRFSGAYYVTGVEPPLHEPERVLTHFTVRRNSS